MNDTASVKVRTAHAYVSRHVFIAYRDLRNTENTGWPRTMRHPLLLLTGIRAGSWGVGGPSKKNFPDLAKKGHRFSDLGAITGGTLLLLISNFSFGGP
jgi:hypothetical protein